jgi:LEA14-like dessication related protein
MMKKEIKIGLVIVALFIFCIAAYIGLYIYSASKVEVRQVQLTSIENISLEGAELVGIIELYNGGLVPVSVERIDYRLILEHDGTELVKGAINGGAIPANRALNYSYSIRINWKPTAGLAYQLLTNETAYVRFEGTVQLTKIWFIDVSIPFEKRINLENYLNQYIKQELEKYGSGNIVDDAGRLLEELKKYF